MEQKNLLILFGGQSSEHEISCMSAANIIRNIDRDRYQMILVGITKEGHWVLTDNLKQIEDGSWIMGNVSAVLSPDATKKCLYLIDSFRTREVPIDAAFPILHGLYGEDGTVQGIFELAGIPYVGCGVLSSALCMDKVYTKLIVESLKIRQAAHVSVNRIELDDEESVLRKIETAIPYPMFIKPSCAGSSQGIRKVMHRPELYPALLNAANHDSKVLAEEAIEGRELECAVFGTDRMVVVSGVGEIKSASEFYDFDAKYHNEESITDTDPDLPEPVFDEIREKAEKIFRATGCYGLARVDFFLDAKGVVFNEINTMPGFTAISMYPMLFEEMGISKKQLVTDLIETAFIRQEH
ncbi:MAG: D-alanine--D-alanine ligase [Lachnospiraceae bacterium]|nr:D-alanine--D-alanine ligase [Lachnospiraceae bacterium]